MFDSSGRRILPHLSGGTIDVHPLVVVTENAPAVLAETEAAIATGKGIVVAGIANVNVKEIGRVLKHRLKSGHVKLGGRLNLRRNLRLHVHQELVVGPLR